jgi:soluble epoxide hydrolase/lipid-phosphate phosphatase
MAGEIIDILDHEKVATVHGIAHDAGCSLLSRAVNYYPARLISVAFLSVAYVPPGPAMDLDAINTMTKQMLAYATFGYCEFFDRDDAGATIDHHAGEGPGILNSI